MGDKSHKLSLSKRVTKISTIDQLRGKKNEVSYRSVSKLCSRLKIEISSATLENRNFQSNTGIWGIVEKKAISKTAPPRSRSKKVIFMNSCTVEINILAMDKIFCPGRKIFVTDNIFLPEMKFILSSACPSARTKNFWPWRYWNCLGQNFVHG